MYYYLCTIKSRYVIKSIGRESAELSVGAILQIHCIKYTVWLQIFIVNNFRRKSDFSVKVNFCKNNFHNSISFHKNV